MGKMINITGQRFGRLVAIECGGKNKHGNYEWLCKCDCGNEKVIDGSNLRTGNTTSCGCFFREQLNNRNFTGKHNKIKTRIYRIWVGLRRRCREDNGDHYSRYKGRGIKVCEQWENDFMSFYDWAMANGYQDDLTIDRIDNNGNYEPSNCRWATPKVQGNNKCNNKFYVYKGENLTLGQIADKCGISYSTLDKRIRNYGWSVEKATTTPIDARCWRKSKR